jgi:hypothetical protein
MKTGLLVVFMAFAMAMQASGRLGENMDACSRRYGSPVSQDGQIYTYRMGDIQIRILFGGFSGKEALALRYSRPGSLFNKEFSPDELRTILSANTKNSGRRWTEIDPYEKGYSNMTEDERESAAYRSYRYTDWQHGEIKALAAYTHSTRELYIHLKDVDMQTTSSAISGL